MNDKLFFFCSVLQNSMCMNNEYGWFNDANSIVVANFFLFDCCCLFLFYIFHFVCFVVKIKRLKQTIEQYIVGERQHKKYKTNRNVAYIFIIRIIH